MDYTKNPFYLSEKDLAWVEDAFASMTQEEKLNQVFVDMVPAYINTYSASAEAIRQTVAKLMGRSEFKGTSPVDAFCGRWDTRV